MVVGDSTKVGDVSKLLKDALWESPPTTLFTVVQTTTPKVMGKIVFMMRNQAIAPTN
jgi:hypothetical protein